MIHSDSIRSPNIAYSLSAVKSRHSVQPSTVVHRLFCVHSPFCSVRHHRVRLGKFFQNCGLPRHGSGVRDDLRWNARLVASPDHTLWQTQYYCALRAILALRDTEHSVCTVFEFRPGERFLERSEQDDYLVFIHDR